MIFGKATLVCEHKKATSTLSFRLSHSGKPLDESCRKLDDAKGPEACVGSRLTEG